MKRKRGRKREEMRHIWLWSVYYDLILLTDARHNLYLHPALPPLSTFALTPRFQRRTLETRMVLFIDQEPPTEPAAIATQHDLIFQPAQPSVHHPTSIFLCLHNVLTASSSEGAEYVALPARCSPNTRLRSCSSTRSISAAIFLQGQVQWCYLQSVSSRNPAIEEKGQRWPVHC